MWCLSVPLCRDQEGDARAVEFLRRMTLLHVILGVTVQAEFRDSVLGIELSVLFGA
jgi:hypothetical protein